MPKGQTLHVGIGGTARQPLGDGYFLPGGSEQVYVPMIYRDLRNSNGLTDNLERLEVPW